MPKELLKEPIKPENSPDGRGNFLWQRPKNWSKQRVLNQ